MTDLEQGAIPGGVAYRRKRGVMSEIVASSSGLTGDSKLVDLKLKLAAAEARAAELQAEVERLRDISSKLADIVRLLKDIEYHTRTK